MCFWVLTKHSRHVAIPFPPHVPVQVGQHHLPCCADHPIEALFHDIPVGLDAACVYAHNRVGEVLAVVHRLVNVARIGQLDLCTTLVGPDHCARSDDMPDDLQQRYGIMVANELDVALTQDQIVDAEYPALPSMASSVIPSMHHHRPVMGKSQIPISL